MTITKMAVMAALLGTATIMSCNKTTDIDETGKLELNVTGLEDLGANYAYEGWIMVDGTPKSAGIFTVDASGTPSATSFDLNQEDLDKATAYILTIEPSPDNDPTPSAVHILAGEFSGTNAALTTEDSRALGTNFTTAAGKYILTTPTDGNNQDENSGIWFLDNSSGSAMVGLNLPTLPAGWQYEGWAVIGGQPVTTGKFLSATAADESAPYSGTAASGPAFPGEDFLLNAPSGLTFPTNLASQKIVISVEPMPDNSDAPFLLKPLAGDVPAAATDHVVYNLNNNAAATNPTGTASK
ncbi:MAG: anti-sigma factor domain-containing protein [Aureispira sp.]